MSNKPDCIAQLTRAGIAYEDALALRRISMTLRRWHELQCGDGSGHIERDEGTGKVWFIPAGTTWGHVAGKYPVRDREKGAYRRLAAVMERYPALLAYIQGDPRGCALYILRPGDVPEGQGSDSYYSRGLAVFK